MINIDFLTLKAFYLENIDFLIGARVQKIRQPSRRDFVFSLRNNGESKKLYVNIQPQIYHIAFMSEENEKKRNLKTSEHPPMFCMLLRKYLEGAKISDFLAVDNERIIEFHFEIIDELSQNRSLCLAIELMGKHSNLILYDKETKIIIGCAHNVGEEKSRYRELKGGLKYIYPPKKSGVNLSDELKLQFKNLNPEQVDSYLKTETYRPAVKDERYTLFSELIDGAIQLDSVNKMIDDYYSKFQELFILKNEKHRLLSIINPELKKVQSSIDKIELLLKKRNNIDKYKLYGDLLIANIYQKKDFQKSLELFDYTNNKNITIELDETKTMSENAQKYYKLYSKAKNTKEKSSKILADLVIKKEYLTQLIYSIETAKNLADIEEIDIETGLKQKEKTKPKMSEIQKLNINGFDVYVGKNNRQNDYIVSKLAKEEDYWFHTRLCAGSHVLLKVFDKEPDENTIFECCKLAREYSSAKQPSKVGVIYTKRKFLKKPPASPLGYVTYKNEKEILI